MPPPPRIHQTGQAGSPEEWFNNLPMITKYWLLGALGSTLLSYFGIISPVSLILDIGLVVNKFQIWRLLTCFMFFGGLGMNLVMQLFLLVQYSSRYEQSPYNTGGGGGSADYALMLVFGGIFLILADQLLQLRILGQSLVFMVVYVWSLKEADSRVSMFGIPMQARFLPWAMLAFGFLMSGAEGLLIPGLGLVAGHIYWFCYEMVPTNYNFDVLKTPEFFVDFFGRGVTGYTAQAPTPPAGARPQGGGYNMGGYQWGSGRPLGAD